MFHVLISARVLVGGGPLQSEGLGANPSLPLGTSYHSSGLGFPTCLPFPASSASLPEVKWEPSTASFK